MTYQPGEPDVPNPESKPSAPEPLANPYAPPSQTAGQPPYGETSSGQPPYGQPQYGETSSGQPPYPAQGFEQPGYQQPYQQQYFAPQPAPKPLSLTSMIFGIASFVGFGMLVLPQIAGIITGHMGLRREQPQGRGYALAGLISCYILLALAVISWIVIFVLVGYAASHPGDLSNYSTS